MARPTPEINAGSMADIAFLLLIFFLMVTTMDQDQGLQRRLPPMPSENEQTKDAQINQRNILVVKISESDRLWAANKPLDISQLRELARNFLANPNNDPSLPEKEEKNIKGFGMYPVSKGVISLQNTRGTSYAAYIQVQNELVGAVNDLRDEFSMQRFGKKYAVLTEDQQSIVRDIIPQSISESDTKDTGSKKR